MSADPTRPPKVFRVVETASRLIPQNALMTIAFDGRLCSCQLTLEEWDEASSLVLFPNGTVNGDRIFAESPKGKLFFVAFLDDSSGRLVGFVETKEPDREDSATGAWLAQDQDRPPGDC